MNALKKLAFFILVGFFISIPAYADMFFGEKDFIYKIQDIGIKNKDAEPLYLGHRVTIKFFIAGIYLEDNGYVLSSKTNNEKKYLQLDDKLIHNLQAEGVLQTPVPKYKVSGMDYLLGYSLWVIIFVFGTYELIKILFSKVRRKI